MRGCLAVKGSKVCQTGDRRANQIEAVLNAIAGDDAEKRDDIVRAINDGTIAIDDISERAENLKDSENTIDQLYGDDEAAKDIARQQIANGDATGATFATQLQNREQNITDIAGGNADAQNLLNNFSPELRTEIAEAFSKLPEGEKAAYRQAAAELANNPPMEGQPVNEAQLRATLTLFGGLPTASVLESNGGLNGYIRTPAGQAVLKRAGLFVRTPVGVALAGSSAAATVVLLQPSDNPFTQADDDLQIPNPFNNDNPDNDPDDNRPPLAIPAPVDGSEGLDADGNPTVTEPDLDQQQQDEEFARRANEKIPDGANDDGEQIYRDGNGNRFIERNGRRIEVDSNGKPFERQIFSPDPNLPLSESLQGHIINGTAKGNRRSGAHYAGSPNIRIDESTIQLDPAGTGAFTAVVEIKDAAGNFIKKTNSPLSIGAGRSTFFPRSWTPERIIREIAAAAKQVPDGTIGTITSPSGLKIRIRKDTSGKVVQAFPQI